MAIVCGVLNFRIFTVQIAFQFIVLLLRCILNRRRASCLFFPEKNNKTWPPSPLFSRNGQILGLSPIQNFLQAFSLPKDARTTGIKQLS